MAKMIAFCIFTLFVSLNGMLHEPFPCGTIMATLGTIIDQNGATGRTPWISAAYSGNRRCTGFCGAATTFYDAMDNYHDRYLLLANGGCVYAGSWYAGKIAVSNYDALGTYFEQAGFISFAATIFDKFRCAIDLTGTRIGIKLPETETLTLGEAGCTIVIPVQPVCFFAAVQHIPVKSAKSSGTDPLPVTRCGIFTDQHVLGAQGVVVTIAPQYEHPVSFAIGQEIHLHNRFIFNAAISSNPFLIAFGVTIAFGRSTISSATINHSVLGWSKGIAADYCTTAQNLPK